MLRMHFSDKPRHVMRGLLANCGLSDDGLGVLEEKEKLLLHESIAHQQLRMSRAVLQRQGNTPVGRL